MVVVSANTGKDRNGCGQSQLEIASIVCCTSISSRDVTMVADAIPIVLYDETLVADIAGVPVITVGFSFCLGSNDGGRLEVAFLVCSFFAFARVRVKTIDCVSIVSTTRDLSQM